MASGLLERPLASPGRAALVLAVGMGSLGEVYQIYINGISIGIFGRWNPRPEAIVQSPEAFNNCGACF